MESFQSEFKLTVHDFVAVESAQTSRAALRLDQGHNLASACASAHRWVTPHSTIVPSAFKLRRDRLYQYHIVPPSSTPGIRSAGLPDWGRPCHVNDPDYFRIQDLQDFESTDFQPCLTRVRVEVSRPGKRVLENDSIVKEPEKRSRLENASILDLIPQPHFIPAPAGDFRPVDTSKIPPYQKSPPSPVAPYDTAAVSELLRCGFRRAAWLIPVRGSLPWDGASTAVISEDTHAFQAPSLCSPQSQPIVWTADALQHLWAFLISIQQAKHLGPLSLSFHAVAANALSATDALSEPVWESNHPYYPQSSKHTGSSDAFLIEIHRLHLEGVDYIKVYHDAPYSLSLRNVLDAYRYDQVDEQVRGRSSANDRKIRILKGARLVLMDERSKAAFLM